jgi:uncharacterized UBP type Zn finger protein
MSHTGSHHPGAANKIYQPGELISNECSHLDQVQPVTPSAQGCEDCLKMGGFWVRLRICLSCGHVGCCDQSVNKHATRHFHSSGHPLVKSLEKNEDWVWCYVDDMLVTG